jgi:hypothetical protein
MVALTAVDPKTRPAQITHNECEYTVVDLADDTTTVFTGPCVLYGLTVTTILTAQPLEVLDGAVIIAALAASAVVGTTTQYAGIRCNTSLIVDPDDAATGRVTVIWRKVNID